MGFWQNVIKFDNIYHLNLDRSLKIRFKSKPNSQNLTNEPSTGHEGAEEGGEGRPGAAEREQIEGLFEQGKVVMMMTKDELTIEHRRPRNQLN